MLSLAYPLGDVILGTLVLIILFRSQSQRLTLMLLALGLGGFALADSLFLYLTSSGTYSSADLVSSGGWVFGFLFVAAAGMSVPSGTRLTEASDPRPRPLQLALARRCPTSRSWPPGWPSSSTCWTRTRLRWSTSCSASPSSSWC